MKFSPCVRQTPYCIYLAERVGQYVTEIAAGFTIHELAKYAGLKPTHNMRKRLRSWVEQGDLTMTTGLDKKGRMFILYLIPVVQPPDEDLPF